MKQMTSIFVVFLLLLLLTSCDSTEQNSGSETSMGFYNSTSNSESISNTNNLNSKTTDEPTVTSENKTVTLENSSVPSVAMNPYVSQNERGETVHINPVEEIFNNNDEIPEYLKRIDLREKGFDIIANEKIYLTPHIINSPKSRIGKTDIMSTCWEHCTGCMIISISSVLPVLWTKAI